MKISAAVGATPATLSEQMLSRVQASLIVSRRIKIRSSQWKLDLQSPFWRLYFHVEDGVRIEMRNETLQLRPRQVCLIPAWLHFRASTRDDTIQDYLHFNLTGIPLTLTRKVFQRPIELSLGEPAVTPLVRQWRKGVREAGNTGFREQLWACALIQAAMAAAIDTLPEANRDRLESWVRSSHPISSALRQIEHNLAHPPTNEELARAAGQSTDHFARRFKAAVGMTPARYSVERRIAIATQRLLMTDDRIDDIALDSGFADRFHFSRVFAAVVGIPPARFRAAHR